RFLLQRCEQTGRCVFYPRVLSPYSGRPLTIWVEASGNGVVYSTTVIRRKPEHGGNYNLALIDLAEGARMMSRVEGAAPEAVSIGMAVKAFIGADQEGEPLLLFRPAANEEPSS
ncbi:MAG TPA: OB-fold domain-containing protein, partial [Devosia sp.]|nr:OB-fold domain-containing protein [Devosia sp.]